MMRRLVFSLVAVLLSGAVHAVQYGQAKVQVNMREKPNLSSRIVGVLQQGERVEVLGDDGDFAEIRRSRDGQQGYLRLRMLDVLPAERAAPARRPPARVARDDTPAIDANKPARTTARVRMRATPSLDARVVAILNQRERVEILGQTGEFALVRRVSDKKLGFVHGNYLDVSMPRAAGAARNSSEQLPVVKLSPDRP